MIIREIKLRGPNDVILYVGKRKFAPNVQQKNFDGSLLYRRDVPRQANYTPPFRKAPWPPVIYPKSESSSRDARFTHGLLTDVIYLRSESRPQSRSRSALSRPSSERMAIPRNSRPNTPNRTKAVPTDAFPRPIAFFF